MVKSAYIHIPFCKQKCKYCTFVSFSALNKSKDYVKTLLNEIRQNYQGESLNTLYFGGGTPSLIGIDSLKNIINSFNLNHDCEVTIELNPDDANLDYLESLLNIGVNRLSIGAQTFDNDVLKIIGRKHTSEQTINAVMLAKSAGFKNISLDLIYGLPNLDNITKDLDILTSLDIQHISTYGLKIEEGSYFSQNIPDNLPDDDTQADMYLLINEYLNTKEFYRYEISNFSLKGYESKHNLNYWNNDEYYGFGLAAHGYVNDIRYSNISNLDDYISSTFWRECEHVQSDKDKLEEEIFLGFRKEKGIDISKLNTQYGIDFESKYNQVLEKYSPRYIEKTSNGYKLTIEGVLVSNLILSEFI